MSVTKFSKEQQNHSDIIIFNSCLLSSFMKLPVKFYYFLQEKRRKKPKAIPMCLLKLIKCNKGIKDPSLTTVTLSKDDWCLTLFSRRFQFYTSEEKTQTRQIGESLNIFLFLSHSMEHLSPFLQWAKQHLLFLESCLLQNNRNIKRKDLKELQSDDSRMGLLW